MHTAPQQTITSFLRKVGADALKQCKPHQGTGQRKLDVGMIIGQFQEEVPSVQNSDYWRQCGLVCVARADWEDRALEAWERKRATDSKLCLSQVLRMVSPVSGLQTCHSGGLESFPMGFEAPACFVVQTFPYGPLEGPLCSRRDFAPAHECLRTGIDPHSSVRFIQVQILPRKVWQCGSLFATLNCGGANVQWCVSRYVMVTCFSFILRLP